MATAAFLAAEVSAGTNVDVGTTDDFTKNVEGHLSDDNASHESHEGEEGHDEFRQGQDGQELCLTERVLSRLAPDVEKQKHGSHEGDEGSEARLALEAEKLFQKAKASALKQARLAGQ